MDEPVTMITGPQLQFVQSQADEAVAFGKLRRRHFQTGELITARNYIDEQRNRGILNAKEHELAVKLTEQADLTIIRLEIAAPSGDYNEQDLLEAVQATLHEVFPVTDGQPVVPTVTRLL